MPRLTICVKAAILLMCLGGLVHGAGRPYEAYMVLANETELMQRNQRVDRRLYRGDVVTAKPLERYPDWLVIALDQQTYQVKANRFARLIDLRTDYARATAEYRARIDELNRDIASVTLKIEQYYAAEKAVTFDSMVQYQFRKLVPVPVTPQTASPGAGRAPRAPQMTVVYDHVDKIKPSAARNQARRWEREREDLEEDLEDWQDRRRDLALNLVQADAQLAFVEWRFRAYRLGQGILHGEPYVTTRDRTPLYKRDRIVLELDKDVVVLAALDRDNERRVRVRFRGELYDARKKFFLNMRGVEAVLGQRAALLRERIDQTQEELSLLEGRRDLLQSLTLAADYSSRLNYLSLVSHPFSGGYAGRRLYNSASVPPDAKEVILRRRARSFIRDWEDDLEDLEDDIDDDRDDLREWRRDLAELRPRLDDLRSRMMRQR